MGCGELWRVVVSCGELWYARINGGCDGTGPLYKLVLRFKHVNVEKAYGARVHVAHRDPDVLPSPRTTYNYDCHAQQVSQHVEDVQRIVPAVVPVVVVVPDVTPRNILIY